MNAKLDQRGTTPLVHCAFTEAELRLLVAAVSRLFIEEGGPTDIEKLRVDVRSALRTMAKAPSKERAHGSDGGGFQQEA